MGKLFSRRNSSWLDGRAEYWRFQFLHDSEVNTHPKSETFPEALQPLVFDRRMLRLCPARAFIAFLCLRTKRMSIARSGDVGVCISRFPVAVVVSLTASGGEAPRSRTFDVPSRDSAMFNPLSKDLSYCTC